MSFLNKSVRLGSIHRVMVRLPAASLSILAVVTVSKFIPASLGCLWSFALLGFNNFIHTFVPNIPRYYYQFLSYFGLIFQIINCFDADVC